MVILNCKRREQKIRISHRSRKVELIVENTQSKMNGSILKQKVITFNQSKQQHINQQGTSRKGETDIRYGFQQHDNQQRQ